MKSIAFKRFVLISCLGIASAVVGASQLPRADYTLDIVTHPMTPEPLVGPTARVLPPGAGGGVEGEKPFTNLRVTLESLDRRSYAPGEPLVYEILVENLGPRALVLPWSPDRVAVQGQALDDSQVRTASLFLEVTDRQRKRIAWLEPQRLFGRAAAVGTLQTISPGESARIRVPGLWRPDVGTWSRETPQELARVSVMLSVPAPRLLVRSSNVIEVLVQRRER
jgi:hypothetical protein